MADEDQKGKPREELAPVATQIGPSYAQGVSFPGTGPMPQGLNVTVGSMPPAVAVLTSLQPDLQRQVLADSTALANRQLDLQQHQLGQLQQAEENDKKREHTKWWFRSLVLAIFLLLAIGGVVALYIAGKDAAAEKLLTGLIALVGGFALGWGAKSHEVRRGSETGSGF